MIDENPDENEEIKTRRLLRKMYREFQDTLETNKNEISNPNSKAFEENRDRMNELFSKVKNIREAAIDAETFSCVSGILKAMSAHLGDLSSSFDFETFSNSIRDNFFDKSARQFSWSKLGSDTGCFYGTIPMLR